MTFSIDSKLGTEMTPEDVSEHQTVTKDEKLRHLSDMKFDLERQTGLGTADLDKVEARMASINLALSRAKLGK